MDNKDFATLLDFVQQGGVLSGLANVDQKDLDLLYRYAMQLMTYGDYHGAKRIFFLLMRLNQSNFEYVYALATCCQQLNEHEEAIFCFGRAGMNRLQDPRSPYFAGISYLALGNRQYAEKSFRAALRICRRLPVEQWSEVRENAQQKLAYLMGAMCHE